MASFVVPTRTDIENYDQEVELDGVIYTLLLAWNHRDSAWYLSLSTEDGTPVLSGARVVVDTPLLRYCGSASKPPGSLVAVDTSGAGADPGLADLGGRVLLMYESAG